jgi:hypothetical protein
MVYKKRVVQPSQIFVGMVVLDDILTGGHIEVVVIMLK